MVTLTSHGDLTPSSATLQIVLDGNTHCMILLIKLMLHDITHKCCMMLTLYHIMLLLILTLYDITHTNVILNWSQRGYFCGTKL